MKCPRGRRPPLFMLANFFLCLDGVTDTWTRAETQYKSVVTMLERPKSPNVSHPIKPTQHRRRPYSCRFFAHVLKHQVLFSFLTAAFGGRYHEDRHAHKLGPVFLASFSHVVCIHMDVFFAHRGRQLDRVPDAQNRIWSGACSSNEKWNNATKNTNEHHTTINDLIYAVPAAHSYLSHSAAEAARGLNRTTHPQPTATFCTTRGLRGAQPESRIRSWAAEAWRFSRPSVRVFTRLACAPFATGAKGSGSPSAEPPAGLPQKL